MILQRFGSYYLPPVRVDTLSVDVAYVDSYEVAEELPGSIPLMGMAGTIAAEGAISAVFMVGRAFMSNPIPGNAAKYVLDEGGLDTALIDFSDKVFDAGIQTLHIMPHPGTAPLAGGLLGSGGNVVSEWQLNCEAARQRSTHRHVGGAMVYAEISMTFLVHSGLVTIIHSGGQRIQPLV